MHFHFSPVLCWKHPPCLYQHTQQQISFSPSLAVAALHSWGSWLGGLGAEFGRWISNDQLLLTTLHSLCLSMCYLKNRVNQLWNALRCTKEWNRDGTVLLLLPVLATSSASSQAKIQMILEMFCIECVNATQKALTLVSATKQCLYCFSREIFSHQAL